MTVRSGIADIIEALPGGRILTVYSGGLHHIQAPGELLPRPFKPILCRFEMIDIASFKLEVAAKYPDVPFQKAVIRDLTERRDAYCPTELQPPPIPADV
jgi:hypothetical protein